MMVKFMIADEGQLEKAAVVMAENELHAVVKYYEVARFQGKSYGDKGHKEFAVAVTADLPDMCRHTIMHHADLDGEQWLRDVSNFKVY